MAKPVLISGIQPTGRLHLGNLLGALKHFVKLQNSGIYECYFFIADYHSLTIPFDQKKKAEETLKLAKQYIAAGLDPKKSKIFVQSAIPAHTELSWILSTLTPFGELRRMTQFKEKSEEHRNINTGLFYYPLLMTADILLYDVHMVPVGEDQLQHLELTRTLARKFNRKFGKTFVEPKPLLTEMPRLMSLDKPERKMSKSRPAGCLFLDDSPVEIRKKIKRAVTDSGKELLYNPKEKRAISNLILIYASLTGKETKIVEKAFKGKSYAEFKEVLVEVIVDVLAPFREKIYSDGELKKILKQGNKKANEVTSKKLAEVKSKLGILLFK